MAVCEVVVENRVVVLVDVLEVPGITVTIPTIVIVIITIVTTIVCLRCNISFSESPGKAAFPSPTGKVV